MDLENAWPRFDEGSSALPEKWGEVRLVRLPSFIRADAAADGGGDKSGSNCRGRGVQGEILERFSVLPG